MIQLDASNNTLKNNKWKWKVAYYKRDQIIKYVSKTANIGKNVKIWHFAYVGDNTIIGDNVMIGSLFSYRLCC